MKRKESRIARAGRLIVFEGVDGAGKTTVSSALAKRLLDHGFACNWLTFPGRDFEPIGKFVYNLHHQAKGSARSIDATSLQLLHVAAHIDLLNSKIVPVLRRGEIVVLDRFWWSTWVYGVAMGANRPALRAMIELEALFWKQVEHPIVLLLERTTPSDTEPKSHRQKLIVEYRGLARRERKKYPVAVISNDRPIASVLSTVLQRLSAIGFTDLEEGQGRSESPMQNDRRQQELFVFGRRGPLKPGAVYRTYWEFAAERQAIFFRRLRGQPHPWTADPILQEFKFTNVYRASDRVSQYLIKNVIYSGDQSPREVFFRTILFKIFNRIETWELLKNELGNISYDTYSFDKYDAVLMRAMTGGRRIYSAAYIMPTSKKTIGQGRKHRMHLRLIETMIKDHLPERLEESASMRAAFNLLRAYPTIGDFLGYQYLVDLNYSNFLNFSEMDFVVPGPGALSGIKKCFSDIGDWLESDVIREVTERQEVEFERYGVKFETLWGRSLQLIDCQNIFCEVDKYARVAHPELSDVTGRTRIKQKYRCQSEPLTYWYPPKWGLNAQIGNKVRDVSCI